MRVTKEMLKTKGKYFKSGPRYAVVSTQMDLLGITDVSTPRQEKNGTIAWRLPIKNNHRPKSFIEVASFKTGYVRNQNSGYSNYQLNKRIVNEAYYPEYKWNEAKNMSVETGKYYKSGVKSCILIPNEIDRLEYLIDYCLKNYYIKKANEVVNGKYVSKWYHEYELERQDAQQDCGHYDRIQELEKDLHDMQQERDCARLHEVKDLKSDVFTQKQRGDGYKEGYKNMTEARDYYKNIADDLSDSHNKTYNDGYAAAEVDYKGMSVDLEEKLRDMTQARNYYMEKHRILEDYEIKVKELECKLADTIDLGRTNAEAESLNDGALQNLSVTVNGERYKII